MYSTFHVLRNFASSVAVWCISIVSIVVATQWCRCIRLKNHFTPKLMPVAAVTALYRNCIFPSQWHIEVSQFHFLLHQ